MWKRILQLSALGLGALGAWWSLRDAPAENELGDASERAVDVVAAPVEVQGRRALIPSRRPQQDPSLLPFIRKNNEAAELLNAGELEQAVALFEACHEARPEEKIFRENLAEALKRLANQHWGERRLRLAIAEMERAMRLAERDETTPLLEELLARWRKEAELSEKERTDHSVYFELSYDAEREDVLGRSGEVLAALERSYGILRDWFGFDPVLDDPERTPIRVVLYRPEAFDALTGLGDWAGGAFDGTIRISVADLEREAARWRRVAQHELAHAYLRALGGRDVPGWLNEGLAQWLEGMPRGWRLKAARERLAGTSLFPLEDLQGSLARWSDTEAIARAYAQSLVLVDHIAAQYGDEALRAMVRGCADGVAVGESFERASSVPLAFVVDDLPNYLR